jgi:hypothetical protein
LHLHEEANVVEKIMPLGKRKQTTKEECEKILFHFIFPLGENIKKNEDNIKTRILKTPGKQKV